MDSLEIIAVLCAGLLAAFGWGRLTLRARTVSNLCSPPSLRAGLWLATAFEQAGLHAVPCASDHLRWNGGCRLALGGRADPVAAVVRFFPAEWLPNCPADCDWHELVRGPALLCNPATSVAVQSKRLPLLWDSMSVSSSCWRSALPVTVGSWTAPWWRDPRWLIKPALGRVGEGIAARGVSSRRELLDALLWAALQPTHYVAQERFLPIAWRLGADSFQPCIGVFTLDGRVVGAYGRTSRTPFVDHRAIDTPVLVADEDWEVPA